MNVGDVFKMVEKRMWLVALTFVAALAVTVVILMRDVPVYQSRATIEMAPPKAEETSVQYETRIATRVEMADSQSIREQARESLERPVSDTAMIRKLTAEHVPETQLIRLSVDAIDPVLGAEYANAWAAVFLSNLPPEEKAPSSLTEKAVAAVSPAVPRKVEYIYTGSLIGLVVGLTLALTLGLMEGEEGKRQT